MCLYNSSAEQSWKSFYVVGILHPDENKTYLDQPNQECTPANEPDVEGKNQRMSSKKTYEEGLSY